MLGVFTDVASLRSVYALLVVLHDPFRFNMDCIKIDSLLAKTDSSVFSHLRAQFGRKGASNVRFKINGKKMDEEERPKKSNDNRVGIGRFRTSSTY